MALPGLLKSHSISLYRAILAIVVSATALAWKARAQAVQPKYGVLNNSTTPMPNISYMYGPPMPVAPLYGPPPTPVQPSSSPMPIRVTATPVPDIMHFTTMPLAIIAFAVSALILVICALVGLTWLLRRGKDRR